MYLFCIMVPVPTIFPHDFLILIHPLGFLVPACFGLTTGTFSLFFQAHKPTATLLLITLLFQIVFILLTLITGIFIFSPLS